MSSSATGSLSSTRHPTGAACRSAFDRAALVDLQREDGPPDEIPRVDGWTEDALDMVGSRRSPYLESLRSTPFALSRMPVLGRRGAVATAHPLATQAGLAMLHRGGNAVDAVIAMAAALVVVEPTSNGLGSDAYALLWDGQGMRAINGSGRAPQSLTIDTVLGQPRRGKSGADRPRAWGPDVMPELGWLSVTVPGAVALWRDLHRECGRLDFAELLAPAISLAEGGFAVSPVVGRRWRASADAYAPLVGDPVHRGWFDTFAPSGPPVDGQMVVFGDHAESLREIAASGGDSLYTGRLAEQLASFSEATGGFIAADDLTSHTSTWVTPISVSFRGHDVWELPPNSNGLTALLALQILDGFADGVDTTEVLHRQIEAIKLASADTHALLGDPSHESVKRRHNGTAAGIDLTGLLNRTYAQSQRARIGEMATDPDVNPPAQGGTVYLCAADGDGQMVSFIQSNYMGFGSGIVVPGTGIALQNRAAGFSLDASHPNALAPGKRPFHTNMPGFVTRDGNPVGPFGVMGGFMQPQGHVQVLTNTLVHGLHPQASLDAPRFRWVSGRTVLVEQHLPRHVIDGLLSRGHQVRIDHETDAFGRGQIIWRDGDLLVAGSESRADGQALVW